MSKSIRSKRNVMDDGYKNRKSTPKQERTSNQNTRRQQWDWRKEIRSSKLED